MGDLIHGDGANKNLNGERKMDLLYFKSEKENGRFISNNISLSIITTKYMYEQYLIEH